MNSFLRSIDDTIDALKEIALARGVAVCGVYPVCMELENVRGEWRWWLDGDRSTEERVRTAWKAARAARAVPAYERRDPAR
jgi:hypothetical protein